MKDLESPALFVDWNFYYAISSTLSRRVWLGSDFRTYPNLYLIFVGRPAIGKTVPATKTTEILQSLKTLEIIDGNIFEKQVVNISASSTTLEALYQDLARAVEKIKLCDKPLKLYIHSSMSFCIGDEMGTLFREKQNDLVTFLTQGWDCVERFSRRTKNCGDVEILNMCINFLGCCTPDWLSKNVNSGLLEQGFTSRAIFLYGEKHRKRTTILSVNADQRAAIDEFKEHLKKIAKLSGEIKFSKVDTPEAFEWFDNWVHNRMDKYVNNDRRLEHYYGRKKRHLMKAAMLCHFADKITMQLEVEDFEAGLKILEDAEEDMHLALLSIGRNPLHQLSLKIKDQIKTRKQLSYNRILVDNFDGGNKQEIDDSINFLLDTGQIIVNEIAGKRLFSLKEL